jgi:hypothetical protein
MGVKYEFNWYLVVDNLKELVSTPKGYSVTKDENRVYPVGGIIPLIFKDEEKCVGLVKITSFAVEENKTVIYFDMVQPFDKYYPIAQHYYSMYKAMKQNDTNLIKYSEEAPLKK